jgi:hypothetical protein
MPLHPHEEAIVRTFFARSKRDRFVTLLGSPKKKGRQKALNDLNHFYGFDPRFVTELPSNADVLAILQSRGAPENCYVVSDVLALDGREMLLAEALKAAELEGWGTIIGCIPGQLAYYHGEEGEQRLLLEKTSKHLA